MKEKKVSSIKVNALLNVIRQCSNVIFPLILYPYITRVLGAANLGKYTFSLSVVEYAGIFALLGIPTYVVREGARVRENKEQIEKLTSELFTFSLICMILSVAVLYLLTMFVPKLNSNLILIFILSANVITNVLGRDWILTIYEDYLFISLRYIILKLIALILILIIVKQPEDYVKYALINLISDSGGYILNIWYTQRYIPLRITLHPNIKKHIRPIMYLFCTTLAVKIYIESDIMLLGFMRTEAEVGIYGVASKVYSVVKSVLNAIILVAIPRLSLYLGNQQSTEYRKLLKDLKSVLMVLIFPSIVGAVCLSSNIMLIMGGADFVSGASAFRILCIALFFAVMGCYYAQGVLVPNRGEKYFFISTFVSAAVNIILNFICIPLWGISGAAITTLIAEGLILFTCRYFSRQYTQIETASGLIPVLLGCILIAAVCMGVKMLNLSLTIETVLCIIVSAAVYAAVLFAGKNPLAVSVLNAMKSRFKRKSKEGGQ